MVEPPESRLASVLRPGQLELLDALPDAVIIADANGTIRHANRQSSEILGHSPAELMGQSVNVLIPPAHRDGHPHSLARFFAAPAFISMSSRRALPVLRKDGRQFSATIQLSPLETNAGTFAIAVIRDVSHDIATQTALRDRLKIIEEQQRVLVEMTAPVLELWPGVLAIPIIGEIATERAESILATALQAVSESRPQTLILDMTGAHALDTATVNHLGQMISAVGLLGCRCLISGFSPASARAIVDLGIDMRRVPTFAKLRDALRAAISATADPAR